MSARQTRGLKELFRNVPTKHSQRFVSAMNVLINQRGEMVGILDVQAVPMDAEVDRSECG